MLLTSTEAAALLGIGRTTLKEWVKQGKVPALRTLGGHHRFSMGTILNVLDQMQLPAQVGESFELDAEHGDDGLEGVVNQ